MLDNENILVSGHPIWIKSMEMWVIMRGVTEKNKTSFPSRGQAVRSQFKIAVCLTCWSRSTRLADVAKEPGWPMGKKERPVRMSLA